MHPLCGISTSRETILNVRRNKYFQIGFTSGMFFLHMKLYWDYVPEQFLVYIVRFH